MICFIRQYAVFQIKLVIAKKSSCSKNNVKYSAIALITKHLKALRL